MKAFQEIRNRVSEVVQACDRESFIYDLLRAYDLPKASVTRLESGSYNLAKADGEVLWKKRLFFATADNGRLRTLAEEATERDDVKRHEPRFVVVTDFETLVARDLKTGDSLDIEVADLPKRYEFFLPWAGVEKAQVFHDNPADVKAAEKMAVLYDEILKANPDLAGGSHDLNVFFARLLFCLFAEDTGIFEKDVFSKALGTATAESGADVATFLDELFVMLDTPERTGDEPFYLRGFPYVNGGLFRERISVPAFSAKARRILLECGSELNWSEINPDIFGSMVQAVVHEDQRAGLGMHYTSVPNIMKVIGPLFLEELREDFEKAKDSETRLRRLWARIAKIKFFDPACGSGNFLIIAYKEIRKLEMEIIAALEVLGGGQSEIYLPQVRLDQFYGIEIDDFAHEVATLSLWLAEHQMNTAFRERFGRVQPYLPLRDAGNIIHGNAARLDWGDVCPTGENDEVYVMGNPPYLGSTVVSREQRSDINAALGNIRGSGKLDYITVWFAKGADYLRGRNARVAFVTTSSICQGEQVAILWPHILGSDVEIGFAYHPFKWKNNARANAGVTVTIIGLRAVAEDPRYLYREGRRTRAERINGYLLDAPEIYVHASRSPITDRPAMSAGNKPTCGGNLVMTVAEAEALLEEAPDAQRFLRPFYGAVEHLYDRPRRCLWIPDTEAPAARSIPVVRERLDRVAAFRAESKKAATQKAAATPHAFDDRSAVGDGPILIFPKTTSQRREYVPAGHLPAGTIVSTEVYAIFNADLWLFGLLSSRMHMTWVRAVAGRLKTDYRYSTTICYNTFPFPEIGEAQQKALAQAAKQVIIAREHHSEKTLADLYDPDEMPDDLLAAHADLDRAVDRCYRAKPFASDEERLQLLFEMYEELTHAEIN